MRAIQRYVPLTILVATALLALLTAIAGEIARAQEPDPAVVVITVDGPINSSVSRYVNRGILDANEDEAAAIVLVLNTPGGEDTYVNSIVNRISGSYVPVITWVGPGGARAISNGLNLVYAAQISSMSPDAVIGNSPPVLSGTRSAIVDDDDDYQVAVDEDIARLQKMARRNGHNEEWIVSAVKDGATVTADEAVQQGIVNQVQPDLASVIAGADGAVVETAAGTVTIETAGAPIQTEQMSWFEDLMLWLAKPTMAYLLVSMGILAIYFELANPGLGLPSILGVIMLVIGLMGLSGLPVSWIGLGLMLGAFALFLLDIFLPSLGLLTIGGLAMFLIGSNTLIARGASEDLQVPQHVITTVTICLGILAILIGMLAVKAQFWRKKAGREDLIGRSGETSTPLDPSGMVYVFGELWNATSSAGPIEVNQTVVVEQVDGIRLIVRPGLATVHEAVESVGDRTTVIPVRPAH